MKPSKKSNNDCNIKYIIWDIETTQEPDENDSRSHKPNLVVAFEIIIKHRYIEDVEASVDGLEPHVFKGDSCIDEYCLWVMAEESNITQGKPLKVMIKLFV